MIKKHELRIGNIVNCHFLTANFNAAVLEVRYGGVLVQDGEYNNTYGYDNISPIELSPEILEKAGFIKDLASGFGGYVKYISQNEAIRVVKEELIGYCWPLYGNTKVKVNFLHQLQNLIFALSGEELTIQL